MHGGPRLNNFERGFDPNNFGWGPRGVDFFPSGDRPEKNILFGRAPAGVDPPLLCRAAVTWRRGLTTPHAVARSRNRVGGGTKRPALGEGACWRAIDTCFAKPLFLFKAPPRTVSSSCPFGQGQDAVRGGAFIKKG